MTRRGQMLCLCEGGGKREPNHGMLPHGPSSVWLPG